MGLTPLEIQKTRFSQKLRGYDPQEVNDFLELVAEELSRQLGEVDRLERENRYYRQRLEEAGKREHQLQETLLRAQKVSDEITDAAKREAKLMVRESEIAGDKIVRQAVEQSTRIESKLEELRIARREMQLKLKNTIDLFQHILEADMEDERETAIVRTMPLKKKEA
ncbi:MAG: DivIVA domain-containing protein [Acidobacteriota bacterium]